MKEQDTFHDRRSRKPRRGSDEHQHGKRDFWSEWRSERHHHSREEHLQAGRALSPKEMEAWREFFQKTFGTWPEDHWIFGGRRFSPWNQGIDQFNPFISTLLSKGGGLLPLYVLHLISQKPRYGNEIMDLISEQTSGTWVANPGAIYPLLTLLEKEGFIEGQWEDPDKRSIRIYTITQKGNEEVSRIAMIIMPKLVETQTLVQILIENMQLMTTSKENTDLNNQEDGFNSTGTNLT